MDIPYGAEDLLYGIFKKKNYQYSDSVNSFKNSARTIKADLEAFSINKEASVRDFNGILTHGVCVSTAVLYQLSYEDPCIGSRPIC